jgi:hypothetical protein
MKLYHEYFHLFYGLTAFFIFNYFFHLNLMIGIIVSVIASYLPDIDHIISSFTYGRHTLYGKNVKRLFLSFKFSEAIEYIRKNHKDNKFIISHNLLTPLIFFVISMLLVKNYLSLFFFVAVFHYLFDITEDYFVFGKLNSNWYLKFGPRN